MKIFGAGFAGLIAGCVFPKAKIYEKNEVPFISHQALLRFRTNKISEITGIKFRKVSVLKSIWLDDKEVSPSPRIVSMYSKKVANKYQNRSIMDISTTTRFIAPDDFHKRLVEINKDNIVDNYTVDINDYETNRPIISTLPLAINSQMLGYDFKTVRNTNSIYVNKFKITMCDMYCTIYFPSEYTSIYRASITGDVLIVESINKLYGDTMNIVLESLAISDRDIEQVLKNHEQPMGKLTEVNDDERRVQIYKMSHDHDCFSLGRFALHKNILLDDVAKDIFVIKSMINDDTYGNSTRNRL